MTKSSQNHFPQNLGFNYNPLDHKTWGVPVVPTSVNQSFSPSSSPSEDSFVDSVHNWSISEPSTKVTKKRAATVPQDVPTNLLEKDQKFNLTLYKTELCRAWEEKRNCKFGDGCLFAHGKDQLREVPRHPKYKTEICRVYHTGGTCPYGVRCRFIHDFNEARANWASAWQKWNSQLEALQAETGIVSPAAGPQEEEIDLGANFSSYKKSHKRVPSIEEVTATQVEEPVLGHRRSSSGERRLSIFASLCSEPTEVH